jgi:SAM-dependent methyltransferase
MRWAVVEALTSGLEPGSILEIGCGQGGFGARLALRGGYLGVESDPTSWTTARRAIEPFGGEVRNVSWLDLAPGPTYDLVCAFEVLEHVPDDRAELAGWRELVTPGGYLVLSMPAWPQRFNAWDTHVGHRRRYEPGATAALLVSAGFADPDVVVYGWPLGYALEAGRAWVGRRREASHPAAAGVPLPARTAASGRTLQPGRLVGRATEVGIRPFVALQRRRPDRGTGLVAMARRPLAPVR